MKLLAPKPPSSSGDNAGRRGFSRPIAIFLVVGLAIVGAGIGYFAGSQDGVDGGPNDERRDQARTTENIDNSLPKVLCRVGTDSDPELALETEPSECEVLRVGAEVDAPPEDAASAVDLDWVEWSGRRAVANGRFVIPSVGPRPAVIRLDEPKLVCGELAFTSFSAELDGSEPLTYEGLLIEGCLPGESPTPNSATGEFLDEFDTGDGPVARIPPVAEGADAFIIKPDQSCPSGWEESQDRNNQTGQLDTSCRRLGS